METRFLILRHPETTANTDRRYIGRGDSPYTPLGERQAVLLADEIARWRPDRLYSSPLRRALEPAEAAAARLGIENTVDERLTELDFGAAEGHTYEEVERAGISFNFHSEHEPVAPGGESRQAIFERTAEFAVEQAALGGKVAIVTHGGVFRSMIVDLLALPLHAIWSFDIRPAQLAEVRAIDGHGTLVTFRRPEGERAEVPPGEPAP